MIYFWFVVAGAFAGVCAGLFGVGGGLIIVPALVWILTAYGMPADVVTHVAVGTALATIILTSISSMSAHHKRGGVRWDIFKNMAKGLVLGSLVGAWVATLIDGKALQAVIGGGAVLMAVKMLFFPNKENTDKPPPKDYAQSAVGVVIGVLSAIFGIGGELDRAVSVAQWRANEAGGGDECGVWLADCSGWGVGFYVVWADECR